MEKNWKKNQIVPKKFRWMYGFYATEKRKGRFWFYAKISVNMLLVSKKKEIFNQTCRAWKEIILEWFIFKLQNC